MAESQLYDLLLLLSNDVSEEQRARVLSLVESSIAQAGGQVERNDNWGRRPMAFEIRHQPEAEYHLLQFRAPGSMIEELSHTLRITDGVLRVRIIKVRRGTPDAKGSPPPVVAAVGASSTSASSGFSESGSGREATPAAAGSDQEPTEATAAEPEETVAQAPADVPAEASTPPPADGDAE